MISLATFSTSIRVSPEGGEASLLTGATGSFSALLAGHRPEQAAKVDVVAPVEGADAVKGSPASAELLTATLPGIVLPAAAEGGKKLPVALPVTDGTTEVEGETEGGIEGEIEGGIDIKAAEALAPMIVVPQAPLSILTASVEAGEKLEASSAAPARPAMPQPASAPLIAVRPDGDTQAPASERANGAPRDMAVALHVGPVASASTANGTADDTASGGNTGDAPAQRRDIMLAATTRPTPSEALRQPEQIMAAAPVQQAVVNAVPASEPAVQAPRVETLQELTRIVDRLAAAREIFAPAAETLAIEHAEFGELSLRFDQRREGGLSVQVSASNPEAQRAVAQAVGAQSFHSAADDRAGAGQPQNQPQGSASRGSTEREGTSGHGNAARHDQSAPQQHRQSARQQPGGNGNPRSGVFA
jgi:hypothetical protein